MSSSALRLAVIAGTTRPGRVSLAVTEWTASTLKAAGASYVGPLNAQPFAIEVVDIEKFNLPVLDEPTPAQFQQYKKDHTKAWAAKLNEFDAYIFVTGEYNHSVPPALTNALSFVAKELNNKAAGFVSYGSAGGVRAVEHLRCILSELEVAHVRNSVQLSLFQDFENFSTFKPRDMHTSSVISVAKQLHGWAAALRTLREAKK